MHFLSLPATALSTFFLQICPRPENKTGGRVSRVASDAKKKSGRERYFRAQFLKWNIARKEYRGQKSKTKTLSGGKSFRFFFFSLSQMGKKEKFEENVCVPTFTTSDGRKISFRCLGCKLGEKKSLGKKEKNYSFEYFEP